MWPVRKVEAVDTRSHYDTPGCMSRPVRVSDALARDARLVGRATRRSIADQIEFWARLGRAVETLLRGDQMLALCKAGKAKPLSACLESIDSAEGRRRLAIHLKSLPYPHYEAAPASKGLVVRIDAGGKRTTGRFVNRRFQSGRSVRLNRPPRSPGIRPVRPPAHGIKLQNPHSAKGAPTSPAHS